MAAKTSVQDNKKQGAHATPFEQITEIEHVQEARVLEISNRLEQEKHEAEKSLLSTEKTQEETMRKRVAEELAEYARTEPARILKDSQQQTQSDTDAITAHAEKQIPKTLTTIITPLLEGSLF
jgi:hypothetical protein